MQQKKSSLKEPVTFCSIITPDYIHYVLALRDSLLQFDSEVQLYILTTQDDLSLNNDTHNYPGLFFLNISQVCRQGAGRVIFEKYFHKDKDAFRWSMKPVLLSYLLHEMKFEKVIYVDCDIHFYNDYHFLVDLLNEHNVLLSPHFRSSDPDIDPVNFEKNFKEGIYNAGFIAISKDAEEVLNWWTKACIYKCEKKVRSGYYVDQKYLDLLPARFEKVFSLTHLGCNVAEWNINECRRVLVEDEVMINGYYKIVFIHFVYTTVAKILENEDALLKSHLELYNNRLKKYKPGFDLIDQTWREIRLLKNKTEAHETGSVSKIFGIKKVFYKAKSLFKG